MLFWVKKMSKLRDVDTGFCVRNKRKAHLPRMRHVLYKRAGTLYFHLAIFIVFTGLLNNVHLLQLYSIYVDVSDTQYPCGHS